VRALALKHALSAKAKGANLVVLADMEIEQPKTGALRERLKRLGLGSALFVDGDKLNDNFRLAIRNVADVDLLPVRGINVYDILRRDKLVLTRRALNALEERLG
jgi:large subunit ribosomal protein L4